MKYFCNAKIFKTLEYDKRLKSGLKEGVLISQLHLVIDKKFFHHSSPANNPANSYYVNQNFFTSNINDFQIRYIRCIALLGIPNFRGIPLILGVSPLILGVTPLKLGVTPLKLGVPPDMNVGYLVKKVLEKLKKIILC